METPQLTLFCLPDAGGSPVLFKDWQQAMPPSCAVHPIMLPGRGTRVAVPPIGDYRALVRWIAAYINAHSAAPETRRPFRFALYGHGAGARFLFGAAVELAAARGLKPERCFFAASAPPHLSLDKPAATASGKPSPSTDKTVPPLLQADLRASEEAVQDIDRRLDSPFTLFAWKNDQVLEATSVWAWENYSLGGARCVVLPGEPISIRRDAGLALAEIRADLGMRHIG